MSAHVVRRHAAAGQSERIRIRASWAACVRGGPAQARVAECLSREPRGRRWNFEPAGHVRFRQGARWPAPSPTWPDGAAVDDGHRMRAGGTGARARGAGCHRPGQRRLHRARHRQGGGRRCAAGRHPARHAGRSGQFDAPDHPGHAGVEGAGGGVRRARRRARGQRRHLHPVRRAHRRHGARHHPGRGHARRHRIARQRAQATGRCPADAGGRARRQRAAQRQTRRCGKRRRRPGRCDDGQARQRCRGLHPRPGAAARPQCRVGRARGARGRQPDGERGVAGQRDRCHRHRCRRTAGQDRRAQGAAAQRRRHAGHARCAHRNRAARLGGNACCR